MSGQSWQGFFARAGTPKPIVDALNAALVADLKKPETATRFNTMGIVAQWDTPEEFRAFIAAETEKWGKVIKAAGSSRSEAFSRRPSILRRLHVEGMQDAMENRRQHEIRWR